MIRFSPIPALVAVLALGGLAAPTAFAQDEAALTAATTDAGAFAKMAASANMFEIESSKLALEKSQKDEVKAFAQKMIDDHTAAGEKFKQAAEAAAVEVPTAMNEADTAALEVLKAATDFDQAYIAAQVKAHDAAVQLFEGFSTKGAEGPLRDFAAATLPTLQDHKTQVHALAGE